MAIDVATLQATLVADTSRFTGKMAAAGKQTGMLTSGVGRSHRALKTLGVAAAKSGLILGGTLAYGAKKSLDAFMESERMMAQTNARLKSTGGIANVTAKSVTNLATKISLKTGIDDEAVQASENMLLTFTKVRNEAGRGNKVFDQATVAIADMATAMNSGLTPSAEQMAHTSILVGKALADPVKGLTALHRVGVEFTAGQKKQIETLVKSGKTMQAQKVILKELNTEFGGSAKAAGQTFEGSMNKAKVAFQNLLETIGGKMAPAIGKAATKFAAFVTQMQNGTGAGGRFADKLVSGFNRAKAAVQPLINKLKTIFTDKNLSLGEKFGKAFDAVAPVIATALGKAFFTAAPRAVSSFAKAFMASGTWGKLAAFGWIAWKLGVFKKAGEAAVARIAAAFAAEKATEAASASGAAAAGGWLKNFKKAFKPLAIAAIIADAFINADTAGEDPAKLKKFVAGARARVKEAKAAFQDLAKSITGLPTPKALKLIVKNEDALGKIGISVSELKKYGKLREVAKILASNGDAKTKLAKVQKLMDAFYRARTPAQIKADSSQAVGRIAAVREAINRMLTAVQDANRNAILSIDVSRAIANVQSVAGAIQRMLDLLRQYNATPVKPKAKASSVDKPKNLAEATKAARDLQRRFDREDIQAQRQEIKNRAHLGEKLAPKATKGLTGAALSEAKAHNERNKAIREARKELQAFNAEQAQTNARAKEMNKANHLVAAFEKAKAKAKEFKDAVKSAASEAVSAFQSQWEGKGGQGRAFDKQARALMSAFDAATQTQIDTGPASQALRDAQAEEEKINAARTDAQQSQAVLDAQAAVTAAITEDEKVAAQKQLNDALFEQAETARQRKLTELQAAADTERVGIEASRNEERIALENKLNDDRAALMQSDSDTFAAKLQTDLDNYAQFVADLAALGIIAPAQPTTTAPGTKPKPKPKPKPKKPKHRWMGGTASGWTMVGEQGRELINLPGGSRVYNNRDTEQMAGGNQVNQTFNVYPSASLTVETLASRLAWLGAHG